MTSVCCRWVGVGRVEVEWWQRDGLLASSLRCVRHLAIGDDRVFGGRCVVRSEKKVGQCFILVK